MTDFSNPILAGDTLVRQAMQSEGFVSGVEGWRIDRDGSAEFQNITARGDLVATRVDIDNTNMNGVDRGRIVLDSIEDIIQGDFENQLQFHLGQENIDDKLGSGVATQDDPGQLLSAVDPIAEQPEMRLRSPNFDSRKFGIITIRGESADGTIPPKLLLGATTPSGVGTQIEAETMRAQFNQNNTTESVSEGAGFAVESNPAQLVFTAPASGVVTWYLMADIELETNPVANIEAGLTVGFRTRNGGTIGSGTIFLDRSFDSAVIERTYGAGAGGSRGNGGTRSVQGTITGLTPGNQYNVQTMNSLSISNGGDADMAHRNVVRRSILIRPEM